MQLRPYQQEAIEALFDYWASEPGNPLIDLATGTGKSLVMATTIQRLLEGWPDMRILIATHVAELIEQDFKELTGLWPWAPAGILSAGLGQRNTYAQILFAGIQTAHTKAAQIGHVDVLMVDEAHLIPPKANTMYGRFIEALRAINPDLKIVGLTATPFRLGSGRLDEGDDRLFDKVVYTYGIADGIRDGYLSPLVSKGMTTEFDLSGVAKKGGDYVPGALQDAVDQDEVTRAAVDEIVGYGRDRRSWMAFCSGVKHAHHVRDEIRSRGFSAEVVTGETPAPERRRIIEDFKAGRIRCLTNNSVLTTGFNAPGVDLIAALRPTLSPSLYVQAVGRGTRLAPGKTNCLVLDFAGWVMTHGPVDDVRARKPGKGQGEAPVKVCPECFSLVHASARVCADCGNEFEFEEKPKHKATADSAPILSTAEPEWLPVTGRRFRYHDKPGGTDSVRVDFDCGLTVHKMWVCPEHKGFAKQKADRFWAQHGGTMPAPKGVQEWLDREGELRMTAEISVRPSGRYFEVVGVRPAVEMREAA
ncbi:DNA helicase [Hyphomicrobiales bacterium]|nr:DNA helicase [Hyphomicrobiales bacterium]CAH1669423.1 DNA helicase [Hyphomicrobiales bacterium]